MAYLVSEHFRGLFRSHWKAFVGIAIFSCFVVALVALVHGNGPPSSLKPPPTPFSSTTSRGTSAGSPPSRSAPEFLTSLPVASGDMPQIGLVNIGGQSFPHSLYYTNTVKIPPTYSTHFSLTGTWKVFVAWVGIQPDPTDQLVPNGSCTRDAGSTFEVLVNQNRVQEGEVPCGRTQRISVSVAGAHDLNLVFNLNIVGATGDFAWANATLH